MTEARYGQKSLEPSAGLPTDAGGEDLRGRAIA